MTIRQMVPSALTRAVELSADLADLLLRTDPTEGKPTEDRLTELQTLLEALPLGTDSGTLCLLRNWTSGCRELWLAGESFPARSQMQQIHLTLRRVLTIDPFAEPPGGTEDDLVGEMVARLRLGFPFGFPLGSEVA